MCAFVTYNSGHEFFCQGELKRSGGREVMPKSLPLKPGQSGLRPPGFSTLPAVRLATFGFVRSSSVSSASSNQSNDSGHGDARRLAQRESPEMYNFSASIFLRKSTSDSSRVFLQSRLSHPSFHSQTNDSVIYSPRYFFPSSHKRD